MIVHIQIPKETYNTYSPADTSINKVRRVKNSVIYYGFWDVALCSLVGEVTIRRTSRPCRIREHSNFYFAVALHNFH
jgi:hypothetical protein